MLEAYNRYTKPNDVVWDKTCYQVPLLHVNHRRLTQAPGVSSSYTETDIVAVVTNGSWSEALTACRRSMAGT